MRKHKKEIMIDLSDEIISDVIELPPDQVSEFLLQFPEYDVVAITQKPIVILVKKFRRGDK